MHCATIDCTKAFDRVDRHILIKKLMDSKLPRILVDIISCMYNNSFANISVNGVKGGTWKIGNGVRQGGILSPLLFSFYVNNLLAEVSKLNEGCSLMGYKTSIICYADDIIFLAPSARGLQAIVALATFYLIFA